VHLLIVAAMAASHALASDFRSYRIAASNLVKMATSPAKTNVIGNLCQRLPSEEQRTVCKQSSAMKWQHLWNEIITFGNQ
jgi:hypothetical protein